MRPPSGGEKESREGEEVEVEVEEGGVEAEGTGSERRRRRRMGRMKRDGFRWEDMAARERGGEWRSVSVSV